jgi:hypothetical protein
MLKNINLQNDLKNAIGKEASDSNVVGRGFEGLKSTNEFINAIPTNEDESNEQIIKKPIKIMKKSDLFGKNKMKKPVGKLTSMKPIMGEDGETTEATSAGSAGGYSQPLFTTKPKRLDSMFKDEQPKKKVKGGFVYENKEKLKGGKADNKTFEDLVNKNKQKGKDIGLIEKELKKQLNKGIKVEMEHTDDRGKAKEIAMDHLFEDPKYYDKLQKIETNEDNNWTKLAQTNIDNIFSDMPKLKDLKQFGLKYSIKSLKNLLLKKKRPDGSFGDNKWNRDEMPFPPELDVLNAIFQSRIAEYYFTQEAKKKNKHHYEWANLITKDSLDNFPIPEQIFVTVIYILNKDSGDTQKIEATEATSTASSGQYSTPKMWAKSMNKKDFRGASKPQIPGGKFVQVKKKCKTFPYCNQGDVKALNIFENNTLKKVISKVSREHNISENVIKTILAYEYEKNKKSK